MAFRCTHRGTSTSCDGALSAQLHRNTIVGTSRPSASMRVASSATTKCVQRCVKTYFSLTHRASR